MSESMEYDIAIVGAGPAGLSCAIRLAQLNIEKNKQLSVCVLEKGAEVGSHILSGAVLEPNSLNQLLPDWQKQADFPFTPVTQDHFYWLSQNHAFKLPTPKPMNNAGNIIISLGNLCQFLAKQAEQLNVDIIPGFPASKLLYNDHNQIVGVQTQAMGINRAGIKKDNFEAGTNIFAKQVILAEGCHGSMTKQVMEKFNLRKTAHHKPMVSG